MFVNFSRNFLKNTHFGVSLYVWMVGWAAALIGSIMSAHSVDDFEVCHFCHCLSFLLLSVISVSFCRLFASSIMDKVLYIIPFDYSP
jgi:hypothetical protein